MLVANLHLTAAEIATKYAGERVAFAAHDRGIIIGWFNASLRRSLGSTLGLCTSGLIVSPADHPRRSFDHDAPFNRYPACYVLTVTLNPTLFAAGFAIWPLTAHLLRIDAPTQIETKWQPKVIPPWPHQCDSCGGEAYISALSIECNTAGCRRHR